MATARPTKTHRIELRTTSEEKNLLMAAASYHGVDVTSFIKTTVLPQAREVVARAQVVSLTAEQAQQALHLLEHAPEPTEALLGAARRRAARG